MNLESEKAGEDFQIRQSLVRLSVTVRLRSLSFLDTSEPRTSLGCAPGGSTSPAPALLSGPCCGANPLLISVTVSPSAL